MSVLAKISIGGRLRLVFGVLLVAQILVGGVGLYQATQINAILQDTTVNRIPSFRVMGRLATAVEQFRQLQAAGLLATTAEQQAVIAQRRSEATS